MYKLWKRETRTEESEFDYLVKLILEGDNRSKDYIFALAQAAGVTPTKFANALIKGTQKDYGAKVVEKLGQKQQKMQEKLANEIVKKSSVK